MHRTSFDAVGLRRGSVRGGQAFAASFSDLVPLELPSTGDNSETGSTPESTHPQAQNFRQNHPQVMANHPLYELDAMVFPSNDPFAYPNQQTLMDFTAGPMHGRQPSRANQQQPDPMQFFLPNMYDDIEGQLLGPVPPYLHQANRTPQGLDLAPHVYNAGNMLSMHHNTSAAPHPQQLTADQRHQREIEAILADPAFRGDWGDNILGGSGYMQL
jgi:hypothetical protein